MKQGKGLLVATVLLAALAGGVWLSNRSEAEKEKKPKPDTAPKLLAIPEDQIAQLSLKRRDGEEVVLKKNAQNKWEMLQPKPYRVDADAASGVANALTSLNADEVVEEKAANLNQYGLANPSFELTVSKKDGKTQKLLFGDDTPTGGNVYAKLGDEARVVSLFSSTKSSLDKTAQDLRDKRLLTFDSDKLTRIELTAKKQTMEFGKNNQNEWQILKPKPLRADGFQVDDLIRKLKDAKMDTAVSDEDAKKATASFGSGTVVGVAKVTDNTGTQSIEVRKNKDDYFAKSSAIDGVYKVSNDLGQGVDKGVDDFRNKKLFDFGFSDPSKLEVTRDGKTTSYAKTGDKWFAGTKVIDSPTLQSFVDKLRDLSASKFVDTMPGGGAPAIDATVTSNDGKRVEKVQVTKAGNDYFAKRDNEPSIYQIDSKAAEEMIKAAGEIKEAQPQSKK
jgi:hypothetical protein